MNVDDALREHLAGLPSGMLRSVYSKDVALLSDYAAGLRRELTRRKDILPVFCDALDCPRITDWIYCMGRGMALIAEERGFEVFSVFTDEDFTGFRFESDGWLSLEDLVLDLLEKGAHIFVVTEHFEQAAGWESNMGKARDFFSGDSFKKLTNPPAGIRLSAIFLTDREMYGITGNKPASASSFSNLFSNFQTRLTRDGEGRL